MQLGVSFGLEFLSGSLVMRNKTSWWEIFTKKTFGTLSSEARVLHKKIGGLGRLKKPPSKLMCWHSGFMLVLRGGGGIFYTETISFSIRFRRCESKSWEFTQNPTMESSKQGNCKCWCTQPMAGQLVVEIYKSQASSRGNPFHTIFFRNS